MGDPATGQERVRVTGLERGGGGGRPSKRLNLNKNSHILSFY
jgi:hypothetical protein